MTRPMSQPAQPVIALSPEHALLVESRLLALEATREQYLREAELVDKLLALLFPPWREGQHDYIPGVGFIPRAEVPEEPPRE